MCTRTELCQLYDSCLVRLGTEGGPLIFRPSPFEFEDQLMGIASYNTGPCTDPDTVGIFTKASIYKGWILRQGKELATKAC